ncbi:uncharacterized protein LOC123878013 isoform X2 [Maniola jurtina]|uniref:uncharacterized protein LOC123878013 isoform X2 n=1 Tax=Maniola jurtina TaxID=191418 RepID=UPI001E68B571|nr:uncharacterized protein LOC123878013 isoform X2 [Maniola jurtina]
MNRMLVFLNLFVISISIARQIDDTTITNIEYANYKIDHQTLRIPDETDDVFSVLLKKDDVISTSDLNKIYSSLENILAKTRYLKDETDNEGLEKADSKQESRAANPELINKKYVESEERSETSKAAEIETRDEKKVESKPSRRSSATAKIHDESKMTEHETKSDAAAKTVGESKSATKEESKKGESRSATAKAVGESKDAMKETETVEITSELNDLEKTTTPFRRAIKDADYLQNEEDEIKDEIASDEDSDRKGHNLSYQIPKPINDESNSSWDLFDDVPVTGSMKLQPSNINIEIKGKAGDEIVEPVEARNVPETKITARNHISHDPPTTPLTPPPQFRSTISVPHAHPATLPQRRLIVPGFVKNRPPDTTDFRRVLTQEGNTDINRNIEDKPIVNSESDDVNPNVVLDPNEISEIPLDSRDLVKDYNFEDLSNKAETPHAVNANPVIAKLIEASEHPQRIFIPNLNGDNVQKLPSGFYSNNMNPYKNNYYNPNIGHMQNYPRIPYLRPIINYAVPQNYGAFKYVPGFG